MYHFIGTIILLIILLLSDVNDYCIERKKRRNLTRSYDKSPFTNRNVKRATWQHDYTAVGVTTVTQLVWFMTFSEARGLILKRSFTLEIDAQLNITVSFSTHAWSYCQSMILSCPPPPIYTAVVPGSCSGVVTSRSCAVNNVPLLDSNSLTQDYYISRPHLFKLHVVVFLTFLRLAW